MISRVVGHIHIFNDAYYVRAYHNRVEVCVGNAHFVEYFVVGLHSAKELLLHAVRATYPSARFVPASATPPPPPVMSLTVRRKRIAFREVW